MTTSEDEEHPALQLQSHSSLSHGWQSAKLCEYPQELVLMLNHGSSIRVSKCQILVHQTKIPSRIEIHVKDASFTFRLLGFVQLDSNESTKYSARELKTISINCECAYIKLVLHSCHRNHYNVFDQIGLVSIVIFGDEEVNPSSTKKQINSPLRPLKTIPNQSSPREQVHLDIFTVPHPAQHGVRLTLRSILESLRIQRQHFVDIHDYTAAKANQAQESLCLQYAAQLKQLHTQKCSVVREENFQAASMLKLEIDGVLEKVLALVVDSFQPVKSPKRISSLRKIPPPIESLTRPISAIKKNKVPEPLEGILLEASQPMFERAFSEYTQLHEKGVDEVLEALSVVAIDTVPVSTYLPWICVILLQIPFHIFDAGVKFLIKFRDENGFLDKMSLVLSVLIQRLGDMSSQVRNRAAGALLQLAHPNHLTSNVIICAFKDFAVQNVERNVHWRTLYGIIRVLTTLLCEYENMTPKDIELFLPFFEAQNAFEHSIVQILGEAGEDSFSTILNADQFARYKQLEAQEWT
ncbi:hypothetical protein THRCLA_10866 [Thraustotheca clavata]|uniref:Centrosomal protein CEP104 N-terminal domain-containing protein n=1 Tax=Thraustotheca clavata TaxID=74557 RepID=A0A1V9YEE6_9STRA|nr:hypothetical protein THRCLA_10866 [Thraustotheca clavata]